MFLQAFGFVVARFADMFTWWFNYPIQSGVTFGGILVVVLVLTALFSVVAMIFEVPSHVNTAAGYGASAKARGAGLYRSGKRAWNNRKGGKK